MFGPIMRFKVEKSGLTIELAPLKRTDMPAFVEDGGMQSYEVLKFLGRTTAAVLEDEYEWFDKVRKDEGDLVWGIYVIDGDSRVVIGTTGLHDIYGRMFFPRASCTSGIMIFRKEYWGKGIAGACHRTRTMYAFDVLGLAVIRSGVIIPNEASRRAVESVGYTVHHVDRMHGYYQGEPRDDYALLCVNPDTFEWQAWFRRRKLDLQQLEARKKTGAALRWAHQHVAYT